MLKEVKSFSRYRGTVGQQGQTLKELFVDRADGEQGAVLTFVSHGSKGQLALTRADFAALHGVIGDVLSEWHDIVTPTGVMLEGP